jgi:intron-binding protein aquarius
VHGWGCTVCRWALFEQFLELQPTFRLLLQRPDKLGLNLQETTPFTDQPVGVTGMVRFVEGVEDMEQLASFRMHELYQVLSDALIICILQIGPYYGFDLNRST